MITVRSSAERGESKLNWLDSKHTFSFADYYDPSHMHFGPLRVINEDFIAPGGGFGSHPHRDMEIITYVVAGALEHRDSMGHGEVINAGEVQRMSAGTGVIHSEFNHSKSTPVHLLQIWIMPEQKGITPGYEQQMLDMKPNEWVCVAGKNNGAALKIHQDVELLAARISADEKLEYVPQRGGCWLQIVRGSVQVNGQTLKQGDRKSVV